MEIKISTTGISIGGTYYPAGSVVIMYAGNKVDFLHAYTLTHLLPAFVPFTDVINEATNQPFATVGDLNTFFKANFKTGGGNGDGVTEEKVSEIINSKIIEDGSFIGNVRPQDTAFMHPSENLFNKNDPTNQPNHYMHPGVGVAVELNGWTVSHKIPVIPGENYTEIVGNSAYFKGDDSFIPGGLTVVGQNGFPVAPPEASYAIISTQTPNLVYKMVTQGTQLPEKYVAFGYTPDPSLVKIVDPRFGDYAYPLSGKKGLFIGNSQVANSLGNYLRDTLRDTIGLSSLEIQGTSGELLKNLANNVTLSSLTDIDIVIVMDQTNDYGHGSATIGSVSDTKDMDTIYGAVYYVTDKLLTLKPSLKVVFITAPYRGAYGNEPINPTLNAYGLNIFNSGEAMIKAAQWYGVYCVDTRSVINKYNINEYTLDGLHLGEFGGAYYGKFVGKAINNLF